MIRGFCAILAAVLQVVLLCPEAGIQPASRETVAAMLLGGLAWHLFDELFFY